MSVVNCKVKYIRPAYNNLQEWMSDSNNVYIGRSGVVFISKERFPKQSSVFCNPGDVLLELIEKYYIESEMTVTNESFQSDIDSNNID